MSVLIEQLRAFIMEKAAEARRAERARRESAETLRGCTDREWSQSGALAEQMSGRPIERLDRVARARLAIRELHIADKLACEAGMFEQVAELLADCAAVPA